MKNYLIDTLLYIAIILTAPLVFVGASLAASWHVLTWTFKEYPRLVFKSYYNEND